MHLDLLAPMPDVELDKPRLLMVEGSLHYRDSIKAKACEISVQVCTFILRYICCIISIRIGIDALVFGEILQEAMSEITSFFFCILQMSTVYVFLFTDMLLITKPHRKTSNKYTVVRPVSACTAITVL